MELTGRGVPELDLPVMGGTGQESAVGAERHTRGLVRVAVQGQEPLPVDRIPNHDIPVERAASKPLAIRTHGHEERLSLHLEGEGILARVRVPEAHTILEAASHEPMPIGAEGKLRERPHISTEASDFPAAHRVPYMHY